MDDHARLLYAIRSQSIMTSMMQTDIPRKIRLTQLPMGFWLDEVNKYISVELKHALAIGSSPHPLFAIRNVSWTPNAHGVCCHVLVSPDNKMGITIDSSSSLDMTGIRLKHMAAFNEQMEDTDVFEPNLYNKFWCQSVADYWATLAIVPMTADLCPQELAHRQHLTLVVEIFLSFWLTAYSKAASSKVHAVMQASCSTLHGTSTQCTPLSMSIPTASRSLGLNDSSIARLNQLLGNQLSTYISDTDLHELLK